MKRSGSRSSSAVSIDFELRGRSGGARRVVLWLVVLVAGAGGAFAYFQHARSTARRGAVQNAARLAGRLVTCLVGSDPSNVPAHVRLRRIELGLLGSPPDVAERSRSEWLRRCRTHATALRTAMTADPLARTPGFDGVRDASATVARALQDLHTPAAAGIGPALTTLRRFSTFAPAVLPLEAPPPEAAAPRELRGALDLSLARGARTVVDARTADAIRLIVDEGSTTTVTSFARGEDPGHAFETRAVFHFPGSGALRPNSITRVIPSERATPTYVRAEWMGDNTVAGYVDGAYGLTDATRAGVPLLRAPFDEAFGFAPWGVVAVRRVDGNAQVVRAIMAGSETPVAVTGLAPAQPVQLVRNLVVQTQRVEGGATQFRSAAIDTTSAIPSVMADVRGPVNLGDDLVYRWCDTSAGTVVFVGGRSDPRVAASFVSSGVWGGWSSGNMVEAGSNTSYRLGDASLACGGGAATLVWTRVVGRTLLVMNWHCSPGDCHVSNGSVGDWGHAEDLHVTNVGGADLLVWSDPGERVVWARVGAAAQLATTPSFAAIDASEGDTAGDPVTGLRVAHLEAVGDVALAFVEVRTAQRTTIVLMRIDHLGRTQLLR